MAEHRKHISGEDFVYHVIAYPLFCLVALICFYPFYYLFICTISNSKAVEMGTIVLFPKGVNIDNYLSVFRVQNLANSAMISVIRVVVGTSFTLIVSSYAAYFFTKEGMWKRKLWYRFVVITMYFSPGLIPVYLNNRMLGLVNSFWVYIIPGLVSVYNMILIKTSIESMPPDLEESAYLDGAGYLTRFFRIVVPLQKPILATVGLFLAANHWNDFFTSKLYITNTKLYTLQFKLYELLNQVNAAAQQMEMEGISEVNTITPAGIRMTLTMVVMVPIMLVYPFVQKYYVKGIMIGAVKG